MSLPYEFEHLRRNIFETERGGETVGVARTLATCNVLGGALCFFVLFLCFASRFAFTSG